MAQHLEEALGQAGEKPLGVEGVPDGLWVLMDFNEVVIHLFYQPLREFYDLEGLWAEAPRMPGAGEEQFPAAGSPDQEAHL